MRRVVLLVTVALVMAVAVVVMALPALANPERGECARSIAQGESGEIKGAKGEAIRFICLPAK